MLDAYHQMHGEDALHWYLSHGTGCADRAAYHEQRTLRHGAGVLQPAELDCARTGAAWGVAVDNGQILPLATSLGMGVIGIRSHAAGALSQQVDRPVPPGTLLAHDVARAQTLNFLLEGPIRTLSQAAMVFCLMNQDIVTTVPDVKNVAEIEELAGCVALPWIPPPHLTRLRAL